MPVVGSGREYLPSVCMRQKKCTLYIYKISVFPGKQACTSTDRFVQSFCMKDK